MIKKLTEIKEKANETKKLKAQLREIYKHYLDALKLAKDNKRIDKLAKKAFINVSRNDIKAELDKTFIELFKFEQANKNNIGYTEQINKAVFHLYHKIDSKKVELYDYHNIFYYKQFN